MCKIHIYAACVQKGTFTVQQRCCITTVSYKTHFVTVVMSRRNRSCITHICGSNLCSRKLVVSKECHNLLAVSKVHLVILLLSTSIASSTPPPSTAAMRCPLAQPQRCPPQALYQRNWMFQSTQRSLPAKSIVVRVNPPPLSAESCKGMTYNFEPTTAGSPTIVVAFVG